MRILYLNILASLFILGPFLGNSQYYYVPEDGILLGIDNKDDLKFSVAAAASNFGDGWNQNYNFQVGHSPKEHFAVVGNFFKFWENPREGDNTPQSFTTHFGSIAAGAYIYKKKKNKKTQKDTEAASKLNPGVLIDFYMGYGLGNSAREYEEGGHSRFHFQKYFIQSGLHLQEKRIRFSALIRYSLLDFNKGKVIGKFDNADRPTIESLETKNPNHQLEFAFRFGTNLGKKTFLFYSNSTVLSNSFIAKNGSNHVGLLFDIEKFSKSSTKQKRRK